MQNIICVNFIVQLAHPCHMHVLHMRPWIMSGVTTQSTITSSEYLALIQASELLLLAFSCNGGAMLSSNRREPASASPREMLTPRDRVRLDRLRHFEIGLLFHLYCTALSMAPRNHQRLEAINALV